jgi:predicted small lipoprotein YifL
MRRRLIELAVAVALLAGLAACGRHVVLDPETVDRLNDRAWTVKSEPRRVDVSATDAGPPP